MNMFPVNFGHMNKTSYQVLLACLDSTFFTITTIKEKCLNLHTDRFMILSHCYCEPCPDAFCIPGAGGSDVLLVESDSDVV